MSSRLKLPFEALRFKIDLTLIKNQPNAGHSLNIIGQDRALSALQFGTRIKSPNYNIFVMCESGCGGLSVVIEYLGNLAATSAIPPDFAYVENFQNPKKPRLLTISPAQGNRFYQDIEKLVEDLIVVFPSVFASPSYRQKRSAIESALQQACKDALDSVKRRAAAFGIAVIQEDEVTGFRLRKNNELLTEKQVAELPEPEQTLFQTRVAELEDAITEAFQDLPNWQRASCESLNRLNREVIQTALTPLFAKLQEKHRAEHDISNYLDALKADLNKVLVEIFETENGAGSRSKAHLQATLAKRYLPNLIVDNSLQKGGAGDLQAKPGF